MEEIKENIPSPIIEENKRNKKRLVFIVAGLILPLLILTSLLSVIKNNQSFSKKAAEQDTSSAQSKKPEYALGEVIVKFKAQGPKLKVKDGINKNLDQESVNFSDLDEASAPTVLKDINQKFQIKSVEKVFKGSQEPSVELNKFKQKFSKEISEGKRKINEKEVLKIDLTRTYKISFDENYGMEDVIYEASQDPQI